jgi:uncharacterized coiled-coil protein SlyX
MTPTETVLEELYNAVEHQEQTFKKLAEVVSCTKEETNTFYQRLAELIYKVKLEPIGW